MPAPCGPRQPAVPHVLEQVVDRLGGVLLVRPDHARRAALDPARAVDARDRRSRSRRGPARPRSASCRCLVERGPGERDAAVADAPEDDPARYRPRARRSEPRGRARSSRPRAGSGRPRPPRPRSLAEDRDRRDAEAEADRPRLPGRACGPRSRGGGRRSAARSARSPRAPPRSRGRARARPGRRRRPRRRARPARRAPAPSTQPGPGRAGRARRSRGSRSRRSPRWRRRSCRSARAPPRVSASIRATSSATFPFPTTTARSHGEVERELLEVGMAVVPGDELGGRPRAGEVLAGNAQPPVGLRADRVDDRVVQRARAHRARRPRPPRRCRGSGSPGRAAIFSNARETSFSFGWSGATPSRTSPHGVGSRSIMSTCHLGSSRVEQVAGGVEGRRAGADDCDSQVAAGLTAPI